MSHGYFIDAAGVPVYEGQRANKAKLEGRFAFVPVATSGERPSELHAWDGAAWVESPRLTAARDRRARLDELAALDRECPRVLEDLIAALGAEGGLPAEARAKLAAKRAARAALA